jgi:hypothetical protein
MHKPLSINAPIPAAVQMLVTRSIHIDTFLILSIIPAVLIAAVLPEWMGQIMIPPLPQLLLLLPPILPHPLLALLLTSPLLLPRLLLSLSLLTPQLTPLPLSLPLLAPLLTSPLLLLLRSRQPNVPVVHACFVCGERRQGRSLLTRKQIGELRRRGSSLISNTLEYRGCTSALRRGLGSD